MGTSETSPCRSKCCLSCMEMGGYYNTYLSPTSLDSLLAFNVSMAIYNILLTCRDTGYEVPASGENHLPTWSPTSHILN